MRVIIFLSYLLSFSRATYSLDNTHFAQSFLDDRWQEYLGPYPKIGGVTVQNDENPISVNRSPAQDSKIIWGQVRSCFGAYCMKSPISKDDIALMNPSDIVPSDNSAAMSFKAWQLDFYRSLINRCGDELGKKKNDFLTKNPEMSVLSDRALADYIKGLNLFEKRCSDRMMKMRVNRKYIVDRLFLESTKDKVLVMLRDIFSVGTIDQLRNESAKVRNACYYQKYSDDIVDHRLKSKCLELSRASTEAYEMLVQKRSLESILLKIREDLDRFDQQCDILASVDYEKFPFDSTFPSSGDTNIGGMVVLSNQTCQNKELGEGIVAHEQAHMFSSLFSKMTRKDPQSLVNYQQVRACLNNTYKVRRKPQPIMVRDPIDELNTEEDFADIFKFKISNSRYPYACEIMDYANLQISDVNRRELLGVYDIIDYSSPHSTPIIRLLHEALVREISLPQECSEMRRIASTIAMPRVCWPK